ncbi:uncharacterized protein NESG_01802 [Nematocida ausubeli]|uniref:Uncharacterized protein n=1 Tax=Nematocida ausubeli (strain ATCC PRA-371 / ERTm2) TaxID=1913371 RepID=A0A086J0Z8_NEMA1|nr:uncharacterized protein NESG_01802 [Nematocida ausubeli]KFG25816.1 hypothetical protein NESG_01802 [Nematocida ausubeli]
MTYYTKTSEFIKVHTIFILCMTIGIWMLFGVCAANNEYDDLNTAELKEWLENINNNNAPAMTDEECDIILEQFDKLLGLNDTALNSENHTSDAHYQKDSLELSTPNQTSIIISTFYVDDSGNRFYIDDKGCSIYMYLTKDIVVEGDLLYNIYNDAFGNQILIDSSMHPSAFNIEDISSRAHSSQEESILDNPVKVTTPKRPRDSTSTSSDDNLSAKKRKSKESRKDIDSIHRTTISIKSMRYQNAFSNLKPYKSQAQSDITRDKPHSFSYLFTKDGMDSENTKCECSIEKNYENKYQLWQFLTSSRHNSLAEKIECINNLANEMKAKEVKDTMRNGHCYYLFLEHLKKYIEAHIDIAHISATYDHTDRSKNNICSKSEMKPETLGEIYEETQTDLKWWVNSMSIITEKTEEIKSAGSADAELKEKLHFILKLPEVLRDLVLITPEILLKTKREMEKTLTITEVRKTFCIIEYLYYLVNNHTDKMNIAYNEVKALSVNGEPINDQSTMVVYSLVYDVFCSFYQCAPSTCVADVKSEESKAEKKEACIKSIFHSHCPHIPQNGVFRLHGKRAIVKPTLGKYNLSKTTNSTSNGSKPTNIEQQNPLFLNLPHQYFKEHYHVQLVDNIRHTVKLVPIPYPYCKDYSSKDGSIQRKTHSIRYIVEYIKSVLKLAYPEKNSEFNVYPFRYSRKSRVWALIDGNCNWYRNRELELDLSAVNSYNYDVVFYYFEDNITKNHFKCIDFQISVGSSLETPRIPLFLTNFMLVSAIISPYIFFNETCIKTEIIKNYATEKKSIEPTKMTIDTAATSQSPSSASPSNNEPQSKRSYINYYYSDFLVQGIDDYRFCTAECFVTDISLNLSEKTGLLSTVWYTQIKRSVREYTKYCFSISTAQNIQSDNQSQSKKKVVSKFLNLLQRENLSGDKVTYGLCIYTSSSGKEVAVPIMCEKMRRLLGANIDDDLKSRHANWESNILPPRVDVKDIKEDASVFITVKTFSYTQANLGMHYDMLAALFHNNNSASALTSEPAPALTLEPAPALKKLITPEPKTATRKSPRATRARVVYTE